MRIRTIDYSAAAAGRELARSLHETGFAVLRNHPVPDSLLDAVYEGWRRFFSSDAKQAFLFDPDNYDGTQQGFYPIQVSETAVGHTTKDLKEFFHVVPGGRIPDYLEEDILRYRELVFSLGGTLLRWLQDALPDEVAARLSEPLCDMLCSSASLLRVLHYPPLTGTEDERAERAAKHEDINLITILPVAQQPGLQVMDNDDNWIDVASVPGELVVNSGDMLAEATGGYFPSTSHRVVNPVGDLASVSRISVPFFLTPRLEVVLSDRHTSGSYLEERLQLITRKTEDVDVQRQ